MKRSIDQDHVSLPLGSYIVHSKFPITLAQSRDAVGLVEFTASVISDLARRCALDGLRPEWDQLTIRVEKGSRRGERVLRASVRATTDANEDIVARLAAVRKALDR